jgi:hypothetical protein
MSYSMNHINEEEFLQIATGKKDGIVVISTKTCVKCGALKSKIDASGNSHGIVTYVFEPSDEAAASYLSNEGYLSVPITLLSKDGTVEKSDALTPQELYEELGL